MYSTPTFFPGSTSQLPSLKPSASFLAAQTRLGQSLLLLSLQAFLFHLWDPFQRVGEGTAPVRALVLQENSYLPPLCHPHLGWQSSWELVPCTDWRCTAASCRVHSPPALAQAAVGISAQKWSPRPAGENLLPHGPFRRLQDTCCCSALVSVGLFFIFSPSHLSLTYSCSAVLFTLERYHSGAPSIADGLSFGQQRGGWSLMEVAV